MIRKDHSVFVFHQTNWMFIWCLFLCGQPELLQFQKFNGGSFQHQPMKEVHQQFSTPSPPSHSGHIGSPVTSSPSRLAPHDVPSTSSTLSIIPGTSSSAALCATPPETSDSKDDVGEATYVSSKCIVIKYYKTDVASALDDHFQKALAQAGFGGPSRRNDDDSSGEWYIRMCLFCILLNNT